MNAVLAVTAKGGRLIIIIDREAVEINYFSFNLLILLKAFDKGLDQTLPQRLPWVGYAWPTKPCRWRGIATSRWGCVRACVSLLAKSLPSGSFLFPPEWT